MIYSRARGDWRPLKSHLNGNGYPCVTVMLDGRKTTRAVHSMVCAAFYGQSPFDGAQVRHLDGNAERNTPENLCWGTQAENWLDRRAHGNGIDGEKHHAAKLTNDDRAHLRWAIERGLCSQHHAARVLGMTQSAIGQAMQGTELRAAKQPDAGFRIPRITLEITAVRVERLQDISEADADAECFGGRYPREVSPELFPGSPDRWSHLSMAQCFRRIWESINPAEIPLLDDDGKKVGVQKNTVAWGANPWVWVIEFKRLP